MSSPQHRPTACLLKPVAAALLGLGLAGTGQAATTWNADFNTCNGTVAASGAWGSCGSGNPAIRGVSTGISNTNATVVAWSGSGLGVENSQDGSGVNGPHALDNYNGLDALIFNFGQSVSLNSLTIGWNGTDNATTVGTGSSQQRYNDSDLSVYAWTGSSAPVSYDKASSGWSLIGDYLDVGTNSGNRQDISTNTFSSYWLVSALGTGTKGSSGSIDAFKLLSLAGTYCDTSVVGNACVTPPGGQVPEPGSLALLGLGALGLLTVRRKTLAPTLRR